MRTDLFTSKLNWIGLALYPEISHKPLLVLNFSVGERHNKNILTGDLWIIKKTFKEIIIKGPDYRNVRHVDLEKANSCILENFDSYISSWCSKNDINTSFFPNGQMFLIKIEIERISHLINTFYTHDHTDNLICWLLILHLCCYMKITYEYCYCLWKDCASGIIKELGFNNNLSIDSYSKNRILPAVHVII